MSLYYGIFIKLTDEEIKDEKEHFLLIKKNAYEWLKLFIDGINPKEIIYDEKEMEKYIKNKIISDLNGNKLNEYMNFFLKGFGISYSKLNIAQKIDLINHDLTYESLSKFAKKVTAKFIEDCKEELPEKVKECLNDYCFSMYCQVEGKDSKLNKNNFFKYIRHYFILNKEEREFGKLRDKNVFDNIRNNMKEIYGELKDEYDRKNRFIERYFIRFFSDDNDYNYEETTKLLDEYYKNKENKNINNYEIIKQKED